MELHEALAQIGEIRQHLARTEVFRGYRSLTVAFSGALALAAAAIQAAWLDDPTESLGSYLTLWISAAVASATVAGLELWLRGRASASPMVRQLNVLAIEQFLPCVVAGCIVTAALAVHAVESAWLLPGLWAVLFSLGVFASHRLLPPAVFWVGVYYLVGGVAALSLGRDAPLAPWWMAGIFGGGQFLTAAILYWNLERQSQ